MLERLLQGTAIGAGVLAVIAWLRWYQIRRQRTPAPSATSLIRNPDQPLSLVRDDRILCVEWAHTSPHADVYVYPATSAERPSTPTVHVQNQRSVVIYEIDPRIRYQVDVVFADGLHLRQMERTIPMASVPNFRDIGGYQTTDGQVVRWDRVYRSSALDKLSAEDQLRLEALNIRVICDVRTVEEQQNHPDLVPAGVDFLRIPPSSDDNVWLTLFRLLFKRGFLENLLLDLYQRVMIEENPQVFAQIFERIGDTSNLPLLVHCAAGKDRTGISIALLLALLGVPDDIIVADYSLSNHHYAFFKEGTRKTLAQLRIMGIAETDFDYLLIADAAVMQNTLDYVRRRYGSVEAYLTGRVGLSQDMIAAIRENLLE